MTAHCDDAQEYGKTMQYRRASLVVLAALESLNETRDATATVYPAWMRDRALGLLLPDNPWRAWAVRVLIRLFFQTNNSVSICWPDLQMLPPRRSLRCLVQEKRPLCLIPESLHISN